MKKIILYIKLQYKFLLVLLLFINLPYYLSFKFNLQVPYLIYFFLISLFALKIFVIKSNASSKRILEIAKESLNQESPSKQVIINRGIDTQNAYDFSLVFSGLTLVFLAIFFKDF